jgi:hypothetical protein
VTSRRDAFYAERDRRTRQYGGTEDALERPILIIVDPEVAAARAGQIATLALVNMAARVHRRITLIIPEAPLIARSLVPATNLRTAAIGTARAITPVLDLHLEPNIEGCAFVARVGLGRELPDELDVYLDWHGGLGVLATSPIPEPARDPDSMFGAAAAAVLGSAALFRLAHGQAVHPARLNPLDLTAGTGAGTRDHRGPIDVGDVLVVGAGAVATALLYWARELGTSGGWDVVDGDIAKLHNTNRCLTMTAADAGWPNGEPTTTPMAKATTAARAIGALAHPQWYDHWQPHHETRHDLVLPLANGRDVRTLIAQRGEPLLLHATTSPNWTAELHRHRPDRDDCPACRIPDAARPQLTCSTGPGVPEEPDSPDAALPFLSAGAGLLLAAVLADLPATAVLDHRVNHWQLDLTLTGQLLRPLRHPPRDGCRHQQTRRVRQAFQSIEPRRWDHLDRYGVVHEATAITGVVVPEGYRREA